VSAAQRRVSLQPAYVLHHYPYRDTSLLVETFSRDLGRVGLICRGARNARFRQRGLLQPFTPLLLSWVTRGELATNTGVEPAGSLPRPIGAALFAGFYLNELLLRLLQRQDPHPALFMDYEAALGELARGEVQRCLRVFEKRLLDELGYGLLLDQEAETSRPLVPERYYLYRLELGPVAAATAKPGDLVFPGSSLLSLCHDELHDPDSLRDAKRLTQAALSLYLGDRPLKTREVFRQLQPVRQQG
jgi:DNA repair protein RecO (recombination protein O)